jgi:protein-disulfide isomerase
MTGTLKPPFNSTDHFQGPPNAAIELVEFGDYQCPHCGLAYSVIKKIQKHFGQKLKFVFRNFPLSEAHEFAFQAALASEAAARQKRFWEMHDILFEHQSALGMHSILGYAKDLGLDGFQFEKDLKDGSIASKVESDFENGIRSGVNGTPTFYINGHRYQGNYDFDPLAVALEAHPL